MNNLCGLQISGEAQIIEPWSEEYVEILRRKDLNIDLESELNGPKVVAFGKDVIEPIKIVNDFAKTHDKLVMKAGIVDGKVTELDELKKLATIPSREGLLTMFASGLLAIPKDFAICLDLHSKNLEN